MTVLTDTRNSRGERLRRLRQQAELTLREAADKVGLAFSQISKIEKSDAIYIKPSVLQKFAEAYKTTPEYIETGKQPDSTKKAESTTSHNNVQALGFLADMVPVDLPFVSFRARASFVDLGIGMPHPDNFETLRLYVANEEEAARYSGALVFEVEGDSMETTLRTGDKVIAWQVPEGKWEQIHNQVCVVAFDDTVTIKAVRENELFTKNLLTLYSQNPTAGFLPVQRQQIQSIWRVEEFFDRPKVRL